MVVQKIRAWLSSNGRGDGGPPDLDEIWRDLNSKLNSLFGRSPPSGGGAPRGPTRRLNEGPSGRLLLILLGIALVAWLASGFYIVDESQRGIVMRFGKFSEETMPGLRWRFPYPIERHIIVNLTGIRTVEIGYRGAESNKVEKESLMLTDDENIVNIQFAIQFNLKSARDFVFNNRSVVDDGGEGGMVRGEDWVRQVAETAIREVIGRSRMNYVLYEGREQIAQMTAELMQQILDRYRTGISISRVTMQNAQPPEKVQAAFNDAVKAGQDRERQKNEGQAYANDVIPRARGTSARFLAEAEGYKSRVVSVAEGDIARFNQILVEYNRAPGVTRQRIYIDTMQEIMQNVGKVVVDGKSNHMLFLPIDRLQRRLPGEGETLPTQPASSDAQAPASAPTPAQPSADTRSMTVRQPRGDRGGRQ